MKNYTRAFLHELHKRLQNDNWGEIDPDWFDPENLDDPDAVELHIAVERALESSTIPS